MNWFAKKVFDREGGKELKNRTKSLDCASKFAKNLKLLSENLKSLCKNAGQFLTLRCEEDSSRGSILIEFAVCLPVLIVLLFYIYDLMRIKRLYSQNEFVALQMANILQNLARKRATEGKTISSTDITNAASLAFLSIYPGKTQYSPSSKWWHEFRHLPGVCLYRVEGTSGGKAKCNWGKYFRSGSAKSPPWDNSVNLTSNDSISLVTYSSSAVTPSSIYPTLKVDEGESKIILETFLNWDSSCCDLKGNNVSTAREAFGFRFVQPKKHGDNAYVNSVVIFTPKPKNGFPASAP